MAELLDADTLLLLTGVDRVYLNFGSENETPLETVTVEDAKKFISEGHFAAGSMQPKVEAAINFVSTNPEHTAIISHLDKAKSAIKGKTGTYFVK